MLLIGPLSNAGYLGIINLYLVVDLIGTERGAGADEESEDYNGGDRGVLYRTDNYHTAVFQIHPTDVHCSLSPTTIPESTATSSSPGTHHIPRRIESSATPPRHKSERLSA